MHRRTEVKYLTNEYHYLLCGNFGDLLQFGFIAFVVFIFCYFAIDDEAVGLYLDVEFFPEELERNPEQGHGGMNAHKCDHVIDLRFVESIMLLLLLHVFVTIGRRLSH